MSALKDRIKNKPKSKPNKIEKIELKGLLKIAQIKTNLPNQITNI